MLMKCKTCAKEFIPPIKNILNCSKCIIIKKEKPNQKEQPLKKNQKVNEMMMKNQKVNKIMMKKIK